MQKILIHPELGRFHFDSDKCAKGELVRLRDRGYIDQPSELDNIPDRAIAWEGGAPVSKDAESHQKAEKEGRARRANEGHVFSMIDKIANWLATETEFTIPADLKSEVMAWQARKPKK